MLGVRFARSDKDEQRPYQTVGSPERPQNKGNS